MLLHVYCAVLRKLHRLYQSIRSAPSVLLRGVPLCDYAICCDTGEQTTPHDAMCCTICAATTPSLNLVAPTAMHGFSQREMHSAAGDHFESESAFRIGLRNERQLERPGKFLERREPHTAAPWV